MLATRVEIADHVHHAFGAGRASRQQLLAAAAASGARPAVLRTLERLPDRIFCHLRELWTEIPDVPIDGDCWLEASHPPLA